MTHTFVPADLVLDGFKEATWPMESILGVFFVGVVVLVALGWSHTGGMKHMGRPERAMLCWFLCCGFIHFVIEGWVVANAKFYRDEGNFLSDLWKEYAKADSRYASRDDCIICMEAVTAFLEGPGCFAIVWALLANKPWRWVAIVLVSLGQLYGDVLYFATCLHGGINRHSRPEFLYFWGYFVGMNAIWIVVPTIILYYACGKINAAVAGSDRSSKGKAKSG